MKKKSGTLLIVAGLALAFYLYNEKKKKDTEAALYFAAHPITPKFVI